MAQWLSALGLWGVQLEAAQPRGLDAGEVCRAWVQWYLHSTRAQQGTKIRYYFHDVRGGLPDSEYVAPQYLSAAKRRAWRRALTQLRTGAHWLREETGRWERLEREARVCPHCQEAGETKVQDVHHMVFDCPAYTSVRIRFDDLFGGAESLHSFFGQDGKSLASFSLACWHQHAELQPLPASGRRRHSDV